MHRIELDWIAGFQGDQSLGNLMLKASYLGHEALAVVVPFVLFCVSRDAGVRLFVLYAIANPVNHVAKLSFHTPRPYWIDSRIRALSGSGGYGMPSGHVLGASAVWPFVARTIGGHWAWGTAILLVLLVSVSRVYLGVHFISDVIAAWVIAAGILWLFHQMEPTVSGFLSKWRFNSKLALVPCAGALILLTGLAVSSIVGQITDPPAWSAYSVGARSMSGFYRTVGEFLGIGFGIVMAGQSARFEVRGAWWKRVLAFGYALLGAWLIREIRGIVPSIESAIPRDLITPLIGTVSNVWLLFLAPWILIKAGLLHPTGGAKSPRRDSTLD